MFTGIIKHRGKLAAREGKRLRIACAAILPRIELGSSVAVNGVCLTAHELHDDGFSADLLDETLRATTLGELSMGSALNIEPSLRAGDELGGHFVQGHVDGKAALQQRSETERGDLILRFELPRWLAKWLHPKGGIAIDGVSLTVQELDADSFAVYIIPATREWTNLGELSAGDHVNIEADMFNKIVSERIAQLGPQ